MRTRSFTVVKGLWVLQGFTYKEPLQNEMNGDIDFFPAMKAMGAASPAGVESISHHCIVKERPTRVLKTSFPHGEPPKSAKNRT